MTLNADFVVSTVIQNTLYPRVKQRLLNGALLYGPTNDSPTFNAQMLKNKLETKNRDKEGYKVNPQVK